MSPFIFWTKRTIPTITSTTTKTTKTHSSTFFASDVLAVEAAAGALVQEAIALVTAVEEAEIGVAVGIAADIPEDIAVSAVASEVSEVAVEDRIDLLHYLHIPAIEA